jgi:hypothetical protein
VEAGGPSICNKPGPNYPRRLYTTKKHIQPSRKKAGNPNWGKPSNMHLPVPYIPTAFEIFVAAQELTPTTYGGSVELRKWVSRHFKTRYVPESLLELYGIVFTVEDVF